jgi:hypothetical protein
MRRCCRKCGREEPTSIFDPHCTKGVYCDFAELEPSATGDELRELTRIDFLASMIVGALQSAGTPQRTAILGLSKALSHFCSSFVHEADVDKALGWIGDAVRADWRAARRTP